MYIVYKCLNIFSISINNSNGSGNCSKVNKRKSDLNRKWRWVTRRQRDNKINFFLRFQITRGKRFKMRNLVKETKLILQKRLGNLFLLDLSVKWGRNWVNSKVRTDFERYIFTFLTVKYHNLNLYNQLIADFWLD